jgi:hypothetical protein
MEYSGALGETDSWKKPGAKNLVTLSLLSRSIPGLGEFNQ